MRQADKLFLRVALPGLLMASACGHTPQVATTSGGATTGGSTTTNSSSGAGATSGGTTSGGSSGAGTTSGGSSGSTGTGGSSTGGFAQAAHNPFPQIPNNGIPVLAQPEIVTVSYAGYPYDIPGYARTLAQSTWMAAVGADYGVGPTEVLASLVIDGGPSQITQVGITDLLAGLILDGGLPSPTANTIYMVTFPEETTIVETGGGTSCHGFAGYHYYFPLDDTTTVVYAVIATCAEAGSAEPVEESVEVAFSHEFIEAATDPTPSPDHVTGGYALLDGDDPWTYSWGEVADMCWLSPVYTGSDGFNATRVWSNSAAALGTGSPCIPTAPDEVYRNVSVDPDTTDVLLATDTADQAVTLTFTLTGWSTAEVPDWQVQPFLAGFESFSPTILINGSTQPAEINNGKTATMTVTIPKGTRSGNYAGITIYSFVTDTSPQGGYLESFNMASLFVE